MKFEKADFKCIMGNTNVPKYQDSEDLLIQPSYSEITSPFEIRDSNFHNFTILFVFNLSLSNRPQHHLPYHMHYCSASNI